MEWHHFGFLELKSGDNVMERERHGRDTGENSCRNIIDKKQKYL